ncbi:hypothetical protein [Lacticaseibacillus mingshuiensis]|uniref:Uncharacterized protein n=1 Tax=Lacticaseibacillus mingshuiensis TaxID=2799574 RepID=A0ABW4CG16_9LACO|nr:hypothetical protein [Lacticaseibacillus mingshuiensis]
MLDERLIGSVFILPEPPVQAVMMFGIHYHFHVLDDARPGDQVVIVAVGRLGLEVRRADRQLKY